MGELLDETPGPVPLPVAAPDPGITITQATAETPLTGDNQTVTLQVVPGPVCFDRGRIFMRRAIKRALTPNPEHVNWLVGELNGVRVYIMGNVIVMTTVDLNP